jgi:hypothetical protein
MACSLLYLDDSAVGRGARGFVVVVWGVVLERSPAEIDGSVLLWSGVFCQALARDRI